MMTNKDAKFIKSLQLKKYRQREKAFVVEGEKNVVELLHSQIQVRQLYATEQFIEKYPDLLSESGVDSIQVGEKELVKAGAFQTNAFALAVADLPSLPPLSIQDGYFLMFENLQDPGNLGTIIRIADWYGFSKIICSKTSVDAYNPKVIAASMGSFSRVLVYYENLDELLSKTSLPVYGATLSGSSIHSATFETNGILLFGNESQGISVELQQKLTHQLKIPGYGQAESLNVGVATAIFCDNLRRTVQP